MAHIDAKGEALYPPPLNVEVVSAVRGSVLVLDWLWLRQNGRFDQYTELLGRARALLEVTASDWVPFPFGMEHWRALDALELGSDQEYALGKFNAEHKHGTLLSTMIRLAGKVGVTPWTALGQCHKLWLHAWRGGAMTVYRIGEKTARIEMIDNPIFKHHQFRNAMCGAIEAGIAPFCKDPRVHELVAERQPATIAVRATWR